MTRATPRPSAASTRAHALLSAAPDMGTAAVLAQLAAEGLSCSPATIARVAAALPDGSKAAHRLAATRALLRRLAGAAPDVPLTAKQLAGVAELVGAKRQLVARAWKCGVTPAVRGRWESHGRKPTTGPADSR